jgi:hypothetical protein
LLLLLKDCIFALVLLSRFPSYIFFFYLVTAGLDLWPMQCCVEECDGSRPNTFWIRINENLHLEQLFSHPLSMFLLFPHKLILFSWNSTQLYQHQSLLSFYVYYNKYL